MHIKVELNFEGDAFQRFWGIGAQNSWRIKKYVSRVSTVSSGAENDKGQWARTDLQNRNSSWSAKHLLRSTNDACNPESARNEYLKSLYNMSFCWETI